MTYEQYWYGDVWLVKSFREAEKLRQKNLDAQAWLQGAYVYDAILKASPILHAFAKEGAKPMPYPEKPYGHEDNTEENEAKKEEQDRLIAKLYMQNMVRAGKNWGKNKT